MSDLTQRPALQFVTNLWDANKARGMIPLDRLVYRSNLLGQDVRIVNTGGGNTSSKVMETDPITGRSVPVLWIKGSGGDLRTARRANFASLYQERMLALQAIYLRKPNRGPKTEAEDEMVQTYAHCVFNLNPRAPSIDTPLHSFVPHSHVDHTHPIACIALATAKDGPELTREIYGGDVIWVDWQRPGFELGLQMQEVCRRYPAAKGVLLGGHGLINWADTDRACYELSLALIDRAEAFLATRGAPQYAFGGECRGDIGDTERQRMLVDLLPWLRGRLSTPRKVIATLETDALVRKLAGSRDAERLANLGTSCPDHFLRTKIKPLLVDWDPADNDVEGLKRALDAGLERYRADYAAYYRTCKRPDSPPVRAVSPTVILIPGLGMVAWGKSKSESRVTAEFYKAAAGVMQGAECVSSYTALDRQEAFDIEYWQLEEAKLRRMPPEQPMSRQIAAVFGAGSGIGRHTAERLAQQGAVVAAIDLDAEAAQQTADRILSDIGQGIGVAGSGIAGCGNVIGLQCDVTDREAVRKTLGQVVTAYGGLDHVIITAGLYISPGQDGNVPDRAWDAMYAVNVKGPFMVAMEAARIWTAQNLRGSLVIASSVNAVVPKAGSLAYDASKSAVNHLIRELALILAPNVRVNGLAPATVIAGSSMFSRSRVEASLTKYGLSFGPEEDDKQLTDRLAAFYASRTLTRQSVTVEDQARAISLLVGDQLSKTTGQILTVDGGIKEAFLR